ncbi:unnamed protein product [Rhodiola kirilowii]
MAARELSENHYNGKVTASLVITCVVAASGGLIYGYDIGVTGGVTTMRSFLEEFFSDIWMKLKEEDTTSDMYCMYNSQVLTALTSSLYIGGIISCLFAPSLTSAIGHRIVIIVCGCTSFVGCVINRAVNILMLIFGRILLGVGVGFTTQDFTTLSIRDITLKIAW